MFDFDVVTGPTQPPRPPKEAPNDGDSAERRADAPPPVSTGPGR